LRSGRYPSASFYGLTGKAFSLSSDPSGGAGLLGETVASKVFMPPASLPQVTAPQQPPLPATLVIPAVPDDTTSSLAPHDSLSD
jgi:hypothetical protein